MYTKRAIRELGLDGRGLTGDEIRTLDEQGYVIVENVFGAGPCARMAAEFDRISALEGERGGHEVHVEPGAPRLSNIFNKTDAFDACLACRPILEAAQMLLGEIKLHGANLRDPLPGKGHQPLHCDVPKLFDDDWWLINALILIDPLTAANGPTRVIPGSHRWAPINVPGVNVGDWVEAPPTAEDQARMPADLEAPYPGEVHVRAPARAAVICNGHIWHSGTTNRSGERRRMLHLSYTRRDLPQQLVQRDHLTPALAERLSPAQRWLLDVEGPATATRRSAAGEHVTGKWPH